MDTETEQLEKEGQAIVKRYVLHANAKKKDFYMKLAKKNCFYVKKILQNKRL